MSKEKKKKKKSHKIRNAFLIILLILIIVASLFAYKIYENGGGLTGIVTTLVGTDPETVSSLPDFYCLLLGKSQNLTDTIIVAKYSPSTGASVLLSIPRDSYVGTDKSSATAYDKINAKYSESPQKTLDYVNQLTGLNIKYYVTIDTQALRDLVDAIGGVTFDVPIDMDYDDPTQDLHIHLTAGVQLLNGEQAEGVVRFRHNNNGTSYSSEYGDNDIGRMKTQRAFILAVAEQTLQIGNITKIDDILKIAEEEIETNIDWDTIADYIPALLNFDSDAMQTATLPGSAQYINSISFYLVDEDEAKELVNELFLTDSTSSESSLETGSTDLNIEVINATGSSTRMEKAVEQLEAQGYNIVNEGSANIVSTTTIINRTGNSTADENTLITLLGAGTAISGEASSNIDFTIIIGQDY